MTLPMVWYCTECSKKLDSDVRDSTTLQDILIKLSNIENDIRALKKSHSDIIQSVQFYGDKIDELLRKFKNLIKLLYLSNTLSSRLNIINLADEIDKIQQYSLIVCGFYSEASPVINENVPGSGHISRKNDLHLSLAKVEELKRLMNGLKEEGTISKDDKQEGWERLVNVMVPPPTTERYYILRKEDMRVSLDKVEELKEMFNESAEGDTTSKEEPLGWKSLVNILGKKFDQRNHGSQKSSTGIRCNNNIECSYYCGSGYYGRPRCTKYSILQRVVRMLRYFFFVVISSVTFITAYGSDCEVQHFEDHSVGIYCRGATLKKGEMLSVDENITEKEIVSLHLGNCNGELEGYIIPNMELVTSISLADCDLKKLILPDLPKLTYVQVTNSAIPKLNKDTWKNVKQLPSIHLDGNHVEIEENAFTDLHSLKKLSVSHEKVPLSKNFLQGLDKLEELYLNDIGIKAIDVNTFDNTPELRQLSLGHNPVTTIDVDILKPLKKLIHFSLRGSDIEKLDVQMFKNQKHLEELDAPASSLADFDILKLVEFSPKFHVMNFFQSETTAEKKEGHKEKEAWVDMLDSLVDFISASKTMVRVMNRKFEASRGKSKSLDHIRSDVSNFISAQDNTIEEVHLNSAFDKELQDRSINSNFLQEDLPSKFNNVFPRCHSSNPFLVEQYNLTKRAIATRYRPVNGRAFNSNPRQKPYEDFTVNEMLTGGLYRIANSASEKLNTPPQENRFSEIPQKAVNSRAPKKNQFVPHENY
ncbi:hypothetical protein JTB14_009082 [Gonioctena quinquepunctata]|nr:hypothetical protein JTB14_009082 [Gonioctena quinquepunctata]